jgi:ABC-type branched-subunit amino acid transport system substrate-binding protein
MAEDYALLAAWAAVAAAAAAAVAAAAAGGGECAYKIQPLQVEDKGQYIALANAFCDLYRQVLGVVGSMWTSAAAVAAESDVSGPAEQQRC